MSPKAQILTTGSAGDQERCQLNLDTRMLRRCVALAVLAYSRSIARKTQQAIHLDLQSIFQGTHSPSTLP